MISRRQFLKAAISTVPVVVAGAGLAEMLSTRSYFLPPTGGWRSEESIIALVTRRIREAEGLMLDAIAIDVYSPDYEKLVNELGQYRRYITMDEIAKEHTSVLVGGVPIRASYTHVENRVRIVARDRSTI